MSYANKLEKIAVRRAKLFAEGLCVNCGKRPRRPDIQRCDYCSQKHLAQKREQAMRRRKHDRAVPFRKVGDAMQVSRERARQIFMFAMAKVMVACEEFGIDPLEFDIRAALSGSEQGKQGFSMITLCEKWASE